MRLLAHCPLGLGPILAPSGLGWKSATSSAFPRRTLASLCRTCTARSSASGGNIANARGTAATSTHYLKWPLSTAATTAPFASRPTPANTSACSHQRLYQTKAMGAPLCCRPPSGPRPSYWVLRNKQAYRAPQPRIAADINFVQFGKRRTLVSIQTSGECGTRSKMLMPFEGEIYG